MGSSQAKTQRTTLEARETPLADLQPHPRNPRTITPARLEQLGRTLEAERDMLQARPLVALPDGTVIAGNQRLAAALAMGWETIPVVFADLDDERATRWMLLDNRGFGVDDSDLAATLLAELDEAGSDIELTGFDPDEADRLLRSFRQRDRDPDEAPPLPAGEPRSKRGEVYELGEHRLMCGDATSGDDVAVLMAGSVASMIWTDPPYGVDYVGKTQSALRIQNDLPQCTRDLLRDAFLAVTPACAESAPFYIAGPSGNMGFEFRLALLEAEWKFEQTLVWVKQAMVLGRMDYHWQHEDVLYGHLPGDARVSRMGGHERWFGDDRQTTVFQVDRPMRSEVHPTMKPTGLIDTHLENSSGRGAVVLDFFAGSGSTLIACEQTGRRCYAMEIDPAYCDVIRDRYTNFVDGL